MGAWAALPSPYRAGAVAVALSAAIHGAALVAWHPFPDDSVSLEAPEYTARLEAAATPEPAAAPAPQPSVKPRPRPKPKSEPRPEEAVARLADAIDAPAEAQDAPAALPEAPLPSREQAPPQPPEVVALAQPAAPVPALEIPLFRPAGLPEEIRIRYALTSAFADGEAEYSWKREGDRYEITGSAQAVGFFTLFLEGRIDQSSHGRITPEGLRPERFSERMGNAAEEGLDFDWAARTVTFRRPGNTRTAPLTDSTVDWLSMIFQLALQPPKDEGMDLRVFTQRRLYQYRLEVVGTEEIDLPMGRANTLHLRHLGQKAEEVVDVWLGIEQHFLPVKLRYPVARNRLVVEQTAISIKAR